MTALLSHHYTYESTLNAALKINWRVEDLIGNGKQLDFTKPFLPEALAQVQPIHCLNHVEKLKLNQIRGNSYLHIFGLVEEFIVPFVIQHTQHLGCENIYATQAFLCFAEEESKHIHLFRRFAEVFKQGFKTDCECIGPPKAIADVVLQHSALGIALITLQIEWMSQSHYLESVRNNSAEDLDPQFCSLLKHHWLEEAQHAKLDTLMVENLIRTMDTPEIEQGIADYIAIVRFLHEGLKTQVQLDIDSLSKAVNRNLTDVEKQEIQTIQNKSYAWTFLKSGMQHPNFIQTIGQLSPTIQERITQLAEECS